MEAPIAELKDRLQEAMNLREKKAAELANDLEIPKSAISQYLSGKSKNMDSVRMYRLCVYLNVNEAWVMGFDVPMERPKEKNSDIMVDITARIGSDLDFREIVKRNFSDDDYFELCKVLCKLDSNQIAGVKTMLSTLLK